MIETLLDFSGLEDISRDLQLLSGAENNRVLREATRAGANVLKEEVVSRAPVRRGNLRRNVVVLSRRSRDGGMESGVHIRGVNPDTGCIDSLEVRKKTGRTLDYSGSDGIRFGGACKPVAQILVVNQ